MKQHFLGVALFVLIVTSFSLVCAFFYAPSLPPKETVKPPASQVETRNVRPTSCNFRRQKLSYEVLSSQFDSDKNELTSKVKVKWNGYGDPPSQIFAKTELYSLDQAESPMILEYGTFTKVFENRDEATLFLVSKIEIANFKFDERQNLYVNFDFSDNSQNDDYSPANLEQPHQVLLVHGERSMIKGTVPRLK